MTKVVTLTLSRSRDIPFNKLLLSQSNVRRTKAGVSIEELAEDIARRTLLHGLSVRPVLDAGGAETGMFEIPAGGRRYRALELLVKQKRLARNALIPCVVRTEGLAEEDSLAENIQRAPLHALDQFRAFQSMVEKGLPEEEIAVAFTTTAAVVRQRLRLAAVAPALLDVYADDGMTLEQLMAFTVNPDPERQVQVWEAIQKTYNREPYQIRRMLTEGAVRASDRRAQFVLAEYQDAGGAIIRDLFEADQGGWLQDPALLDRLVLERLEREGQALKGEGWKWVETAIDFSYGHTFGLRQVDGQAAPFSDEETATAAALKAEFEGYEATYAEADEYPEAVDLRLGEIEAALEALKSRPVAYDPADLAIAGAFLSLDSAGRPRIERGYVLPEDEPPVLAEEGAPQIEDDTGDLDRCERSSADTVARQQPEEEVEEPARPLPDRLISEMTVHRTIALRDALAGHPDLAFLAVLHALCLSLFTRGAFDSCLEIEAKSPAYAQQPAGLAETSCAVAIAARHQGWADQLPRDPGLMWEALVAFDHDSRQALFAHCAGLTINALHEGWNRRPRALAHADRLAQAMQLDMSTAGWAPTVEGFFSRITKGQILDTVREAQGAEAADRIAGFKKDDMAVEAAKLVEGTGWLPKPLRTLPLVSDPAFEADGDTPIADVVQSAENGGETAMEPQDEVADDADGQAAEPHAVAAE